jgi:hypothetical protein
VNTFQWRVIASPDIPDGLVEVRRQWTFADLIEAHVFLDAMEKIREIERARQASKARR